MAEDGNNQLLDGGDDNDIFVYTGGRAPRDVRRVRICGTLDTIPANAFADCEQLIEVEGHDKLKKIEQYGFWRCYCLRRLTKMGGVVEIGEEAFHLCEALSDLEFDKLEIIGHRAFRYCISLRSINLLSVRSVGRWAFQNCDGITDAVFGKDLFEIGGNAFYNCTALRRIAIPLKDGLIIEHRVFFRCSSLSRVDLIGSSQETISSLHMKSWRDEMKEEIDQINKTLPETPMRKSNAIERWIRSVLDKMEYYKTEHKVLVKEAMVLLELALWRAKLLNEEGMQCKAEEEKKSKKAKIDQESTRAEHRVTCGANIVIKNVLPFLALKK